MADDLDDMIRHAMKTLDGTTPSGYFEALPQTTLSRLEDGSSMEMQGNRKTDVSDTAPVLMMPPDEIKSSTSASTASTPTASAASAERDEDSGLHDIRNLASSTKARISSRRSTQSPAVSEDDVLASSSAGWKAVALPEPAKMVSLPELSALPSAVEIQKADKVARAEAKAEAKRAKAASVAPAVADAESAVAATATEASVSTPMIGARIAQKPSGGRGGLYAVVGVVAAAAAGAGIYVMMGNKDASPAATVAKAPDPAPAPAPELKQAAAVKAEPIEETPPAPAVTAAPIEEEAPPPPVEDEKRSKKEKVAKEKTHKVVIEDTVNKQETKPAAPKQIKEEAPPPSDKGKEEPSFDALLKEAGVQDTKKEAKPKLDKKSLSSSDFKTGMAAVNGRAQGCYQGQQGTAAVKLTIAPSGEVTKVTVSGQFAGTPVAACVESAVRAAKFPPWDGGPQSFGYSYLLAE